LIASATTSEPLDAASVISTWPEEPEAKSNSPSWFHPEGSVLRMSTRIVSAPPAWYTVKGASIGLSASVDHDAETR
jgi:hypothetical protein